MLVKIEEIQEPGLQRTEPIKAAVLTDALLGANDFTLVASTPLKASFTKVSGRVHVKGSFSADLTAPCKRCTTDVALTVPVSFSLRMVRELPKKEDDVAAAAKVPAKPQNKKHAEEPHSDGTFELDEVDAEPFDGKTIDLDPVVREQVLLALPVSVLCRDDCKGLCTKCGQDLNVNDCGHGREKELDPRLAKLGAIKLN